MPTSYSTPACSHQDREAADLIEPRYANLGKAGQDVIMNPSVCELRHCLGHVAFTGAWHTPLRKLD
jgi:hypothetical protein